MEFKTQYLDFSVTFGLKAYTCGPVFCIKYFLVVVGNRNCGSSSAGFSDIELVRHDLKHSQWWCGEFRPLEKLEDLKS